ncbi:Calcium-dependent protein kinase 2 [Porphyridium purpureum]|uniref:Calcium-dependent protein kinase 2 n=1 Tax=Porphyridium purpureum TaxID=35688 RepID=A0A5J4Z6K1_PORPP|nr:Calcium-dependent protein kinase 2 [Porphyridium purpureum]|eukprot:POR9754..scf295_1
MGSCFSKAPDSAAAPAGGGTAKGAAKPAAGSGKKLKKPVLESAKLDLLADYDQGRVLGKGAFGVVTLVTKKGSGETFACKSLSKVKMVTKEDVEDVRKEVRILNIVKGHPNMVTLIDQYEDNHKVDLIMELCSGGELFDRIIQRGHYSEKDAAALMRVMLDVIAYMNKKNLIHRDLKPENFLLDGPGDDAKLKATDFGLSAELKEGEFATLQVGTPVYVAPEVLMGKYNEKCDVWSLGVILYILLCGRPPFYGKTEHDELRATLEGKYDMTRDPWPRISKEAKELVSAMLTMDINKRPRAEELLSHPWVKEGGVAPDTPLDDAVKKGLKQFSAMNKLKKRALQVMGQNLSPEELAELRKMFHAVDTDGSGSISVTELATALRKAGSNLTDSDMDDMLKAYDVDGDGTIDYSEFVTAMTNINKINTVENIEKAFAKFDKDGDGTITAEEVMEALKDCHIDLEKAKEIVKEADKNNDGMIDYEEFYEMMVKKDENVRQGDAAKKKRLPTAQDLRAEQQ